MRPNNVEVAEMVRLLQVRFPKGELTSNLTNAHGSPDQPFVGVYFPASDIDLFVVFNFKEYGVMSSGYNKHAKSDTFKTVGETVQRSKYTAPADVVLALEEVVAKVLRDFNEFYAECAQSDADWGVTAEEKLRRRQLLGPNLAEMWAADTAIAT